MMYVPNMPDGKLEKVRKYSEQKIGIGPKTRGREKIGIGPKTRGREKLE